MTVLAWTTPEVLLREADVVSLHLRLSDETRGFLIRGLRAVRGRCGHDAAFRLPGANLDPRCANLGAFET